MVQDVKYQTDANGLLERLRDVTVRIMNGDTTYLQSETARLMAAQLFTDLDEAMTRGQMMPLDWSNAIPNPIVRGEVMQSSVVYPIDDGDDGIEIPIIEF